jgi:hypothetical protein
MKSFVFTLNQLRGFAFWLLITILLCLGFGLEARAQTVTFTPSQTVGAGSISTTLTWSSAPAGAQCVASGHASWTGSKAASGSLALPVITLSGTYTLSLACTWPGGSTATVNWTQPTTNTDGTALARCATATTTGPCLASFNVYRGATPAEVGTGEMTPVRNPAAVSYVWPDLAPGTHCFAVEAVNGDGVPSLISNITNPCKTLAAPQSVTRTATITVNPKPGPATQVTVQ